MNELVRYIDAVRARQTLVNCWTQAWFAALLILSVLFGAVCGEALWNFSSLVRTILFAFLLLFTSTVTIIFILRPLLIHWKILPGESDEEIALRIGNHFPSIRDRFLNILQLSQSIQSISQTHSPQLVAAALKAFLDEIQGMNFFEVVESAPASRMRKKFFLVLGIVGFCTILFPNAISSASYRLLHFRQEFTAPPPFFFVVLPGNKEVVRGDTVHISVTLHPRSETILSFPRTLTLSIQQENQETVEERVLERDSANQYTTVLPAVRTTTYYQVIWKNLRSEQCTLSVLDRPLFRSFRVQLQYPSYSKLLPLVQEDFVGDVTALPGTNVTVSGSVSKELTKAMLVFNDSTYVPATVRGNSFTARFTLRKNGSYSVHVLDTDGLTNIDPVSYALRTIPDEYPRVTIVEPGRNIDIADNQLLPLRIVASDDYGFSSLRLVYRLIQSRFEKPHEQYSTIPIPYRATGSELETQYLWQLGSLHLVPEDVVEYFVEVFDNDDVNGPKRSRSEVYLLRLPSLDEVFADLGKEHQQSLSELKKVQDEAQSLRKEIETLDRELKKEKPFDWQMQKKVEDVVKRYEELQKKVDDVKKQLDEMRNTMEQQNVLSSETLEKYLELQQLFEQINSEELQQLLQRMQRPMQTMDKQQMQQLMEQLVANEERFRQSIERTIELLKRLHIEQKLDELTKRASEILKAQEDIAKKLEQEGESAASRELVEQQKHLAQQQQALEREMGALQQKMEEFFTEMPAEQMSHLLEKVQSEQIPQQMEQAASSMQRGDQQSALRQQQRIQQSLDRIKQQLTAMRQQMLQNQSSYVLSELRRTMYSLLELSKKQEELQLESQSAPYGSPRLREIAQQQAELQQSLQNLVQSLHQLSKKSFVITPEMGRTLGEAFRRMRSALDYLEDQNGVQASKQQGAAMESMNSAAVQFHNALQSMMKGGGTGGGMSLFQQLQHMAGQQMALNLETQQLGHGASQDARRLAQRQNAIRKTLEDLIQEARQSSEYQRLARELARVEEEMREVVTQLEQQQVNPETLQKQERILSRLLDASRSLRERDYEQRRRAETAKHVQRTPPPELSPEVLKMRSRFQDELLKLKEQRFAKDYQELIKKYFEALEKTEKDVH